jgi:hypothetical protein
MGITNDPQRVLLIHKSLCSRSWKACELSGKVTAGAV